MGLGTILAAAFGLVGLLAAQGASPAQPTSVFEAASVKRNTSGERGLSSPRFAGTTFTALNVPVEMLVSSAYGVPSRDLMEMPRWIQLDLNGGERYDVIARAAEGSSVEDQRGDAAESARGTFRAAPAQRNTAVARVLVDTFGRTKPGPKSETRGQGLPAANRL
jgi:hypothetical protein